MNRFDVALGKRVEPEPPSRTLSHDEEEVVKQLYERKSKHQNYAAYVTVEKQVTLKHWQGHGADPEYVEEIIPPGRTLKIVMVSRFGDCGLTNELKAVNGYSARLNFNDPSIGNIRLNPDPVAKDVFFCSQDTGPRIKCPLNNEGVCCSSTGCSKQITRDQLSDEEQRAWAQADWDSRPGRPD